MEKYPVVDLSKGSIVGAGESLLLSVLLQEYGKERIEYNAGPICVISILYPIVTIRKVGNPSIKHTIRDLVVVLKIDSDTEQILSILGYRLTLTDVEYISAYQHSHLPRGNSTYPRGFCLGTAEIATYIRTTFRTIIECEAFIAALEYYISQESSAGRPYTYINRLRRTNESSQRVYGFLEYEMTQVCKRIISNKEVSLLFDISFTDYDIIVTYNEYNIALFAKYPTIPYVSVDSDDREYYIRRRVTPYVPLNYSLSTPFKEVNEVTIIKTEIEDESNYETRQSRIFLKQLSREVEGRIRQSLLEKQLKATKAEWETLLNSDTRGIHADKLALC